MNLFVVICEKAISDKDAKALEESGADIYRLGDAVLLVRGHMSAPEVISRRLGMASDAEERIGLVFLLGPDASYAGYHRNEVGDWLQPNETRAAI